MILISFTLFLVYLFYRDFFYLFLFIRPRDPEKSVADEISSLPTETQDTTTTITTTEFNILDDSESKITEGTTTSPAITTLTPGLRESSTPLGESAPLATTATAEPTTTFTVAIETSTSRKDHVPRKDDSLLEGKFQYWICLFF